MYCFVVHAHSYDYFRILLTKRISVLIWVEIMNVDLVVVVAVSITLSMKLEWKFPYNVGPEGWVTLSFWHWLLLIDRTLGLMPTQDIRNKGGMFTSSSLQNLLHNNYPSCDLLCFQMNVFSRSQPIRRSHSGLPPTKPLSH